MTDLVDTLLQKHPIISDQVDRSELRVILRQLQTVLSRNIPGDVVELGCYVGTTSLFLQRLLQQLAPDKTLHVYDSFAGLPPKTTQDESPAGEQFKQGELTAPKTALINHFKHAGLPSPVIHKGWFSGLDPDDLPPQICFAFLDGDFYESIHDSLQLVWPRLVSGAVLLVDDYQSEALPGARQAVDEWLQSHGGTAQTVSSLALVAIP